MEIIIVVGSQHASSQIYRFLVGGRQSYTPTDGINISTYISVENSNDNGLYNSERVITVITLVI